MSSTLQLDSNSNGAATIISVDAIIGELLGSVDEEPVAGGAASMQLERLLFFSGFLTLVMALATALYKPPRGVVFERHRLAYYLTLAGIFLAGLGEIGTAFWLSRYGHPCGVFVRTILYVSLVPLVLVVALGGFSVLIKS
ncbi:hypothetical protein QOZ80_1AG0009480 [Eleusine coracana subsp. coracana]|nr:hypothetical protein QOZ80_1AG0009480 [Eleusine coracana subsp. coracana]